MPTITVVGAGFSGLATAYFLTKHGFKVRIVEKSDRAGGLIRTIRTEHGLVESAANGLLNSARLEAMCTDIGVPLIATRREAHKRFIYRGKAKQLPLRAGDMIALSARFAVNAARLRPRPSETVSDWGRRVLGRGATDYLLIPALGGIYAGDPNRLSASLIFGKANLPDHLHTTRPAKGKLRGTVSPPDGMQQLIDGLRDYLTSAGTELIFSHDEKASAGQPMVVCLSASAAAKHLCETGPEISNALRQIEMLSLATVTCFYGPDAAKLNGFGCLFPRNQGFRSRGVLFNTSIFEGRGPAHAETWIFGGALDAEVVNLSDEAFAEIIAAERQRFYGKHDEALDVRITRWPNALPHYTVELEKILTTLPPPPENIALVGNYLGRIGLAKILERAAVVADDFARRQRSVSH
ncbi:MAG TPA: FAD-dependent oxidoreductase [Pyrinomonadaceae bacterium]|nr:FAD-dependent oxidoreductase [Pyrinomonadaceae bacterium]